MMVRAILKSLLKHGLVCAVALTAISAVHVAQAAGPANVPSKPGVNATRVALIDFQVAILQTEEGKAAKAKIEKELDSRKKELLTQQTELKKMEDDFEAKRSVLSEDEKGARTRDLQAKLMAFQRSQMALEQEVRQKEMQETQKIFQNLSGLVEEYAKKNSFDLVFEKGAGAVLYVAHGSDITADIVGLYNQRYKVKK
ncbi:OmpH family outer membrane protein [bacterium]|nr:OmpH family outer membrane protein [bacterium]